MSVHESDILVNPHLTSQALPPWIPPSSVLAFHQQLPDYATTPLVSLPETAHQLNLRSILVKDESLRFGLPAFKILGASWAVQRLVSSKLALPTSTPVSDLGAAAREHGIRLVLCTDGNWGRGVARMARYLGIPATVYVPSTMDAGTRDLISGEGVGGSVSVREARGDYDVGIREAREEAERTEGGEQRLLVMDTGFEGYEEVPEWVAEGYSTMLREVDEQVEQLLGAGQTVDLAIASVGVGSFAQAVTMHFKGKRVGTRVAAVEPTEAACLKRSLQEGRIVSIETGDTIMCGMNCGTVSSTSWPVLRNGVDAAVVVTDRESHDARLTMRDRGINAGPCGSAPLAALKKLCGLELLGLGPESNVVLFCTEGTRPYNVPD